jgi:tetratricopeptide (TPR) repeat protein
MTTGPNDAYQKLRERFPEMRPISAPPGLFRINGVGVSVYGRRDHDQDTGTYIKTLCFCVLFVPLIPLAAYRVADAQNGGWYFLGKERLSQFARSWNIGLLCVALLLGLNLAWSAHTSSPEYIAKQELARAGKELSTGHALEAARIYMRVGQGEYRFNEAREGLKRSIDQCLASNNPATVASALSVVAGLPKSFSTPDPLVPDLLNRGLELVAKFRSHDLEGALTILKSVEPLDAKHGQTKALRVGLLRDILAAKPDNVGCAVELALACETDEHLNEAISVLTPLRDKLGSTEGARILGQYLLEQGKSEESYGLLYPYVQARLQKLQTIESAYTNAVAQSSQRALEHLRKGGADQGFYQKYDQASKAEQAAMVDAFIDDWMKNDAQLTRLSQNLREANTIVHVALDLGIVQLGRAQNLPDPATRKKELEAAEKTFLAIRGFAGNTDEYRLFLGQVYYWLGKSQEGRKLFDELLASRKRAVPLLLSLSQTLRLVGEYPQARELSEEAYGKAVDEKQKFAAASLRAVCRKDLDDQIAWLEKCNPQEPSTQVELNTALGRRALKNGERGKAAEYYRKAIAGYESLSRDSATLNNEGLAYLSLYEVTGDLNDHTRALKLLEDAIALAPGNSILLENTAVCLMGRAYLDLVKDVLHLSALKEDPDSSMIAHLYKDEAGRAQVYQRLHDNEHMKKALGYFDKALVLAPKNIGLYRAVLGLQAAFRDTAELQKLQQRLQATEPDFTDYLKASKDFYVGGKDREQLDKLQAALGRLEQAAQSSEVQKSPLTLERVQCQILFSRLALATYGGSTDPDTQLAFARKIHQQNTTVVSDSALTAALFFKAHMTFKSRFPDYASLAEKTRLAISPQELITLALERGGQLASEIRANPEVREAVELIKTSEKRFSRTPQVSEWALIREFDPTEAASLGHQVMDYSTGRLIDDLNYQLNPLQAGAVLEKYWALELSGDKAKADGVLKTAAAKGLPLP